VLKGLNLKSGFTRLYIALSLIWFFFFIYQSNKYSYSPFDSSFINFSHPERDKSKYINNVCGSWSEETIKKLKNPSLIKNIKDKENISYEWFRVNNDKIEFVKTENFNYGSDWKEFYCRFEFKKPRPLKDRITYNTKKYFYYSFFPIPTYLLIIFVVKGFRRNVK
jgi:hypothetical protein